MKSKFESYSRLVTWFIVLSLVALAAGCGGSGGGGRDPILGTGGMAGGGGGTTPVTITPGALCTVAAGATIPTVTSSNPTSLAVNVTTSTAGVVGGGKLITATFSLAMNPATINSATAPLTFTLKNNTTAGSNVAGAAVLDAAGTVATFTTDAALPVSSSFTATITQAAMSAAGTPLACIFAWNFTTAAAAAAGPALVNLGAAAPFGGFGGNAGMTNQGLLTVITGAQGQPVSIGTTGASTLMTGFHDTAGCVYTETPLNVGRVDGTINTAAPPPTGTSLPICATTEGNATTAAAAQAAADAALAAFNDLSPASRPGATDPGANLGGLTLAPGIYATASGGFLLTGTDLTLDAGGNADAIWIFQMANTLTVGAAGAPRSVILAGGAQPKNVFWQVGSAATINAAGGGTMVGTIISSAATTFSTAGNAAITTLNGRALALNASVTMVNTHINVPAP
jgi:hypothetical protein